MELFAIFALIALPFVAALLMLRRPHDAGPPPASPEVEETPPEYPSGWYVEELYSGRSNHK
ncbi:hypothetical protein OHB26_27705 [Nocardia sp. NBC_01503]|uniref:hypothetical protein n=1 Tax=Nocardia sp. NBC_01503 TaxID=2975997 RepID=UPI002E7BA7B3|nr:hypothetical protein [Nocardia sp. NBC_01503]WTL30695.1 hypothetical protein OHB26_27705 [Nocardia sp. NBC_01503]